MATVPRLFVTANLSRDAMVALEKDQSHYLSRVLRQSAGAPVDLFNGRDGEWRAVIDEVVSKSTLILRCVEQTAPQTVCADIELLFAPLKKARTDLIIEKATEIGVRRIRPVITARTQSETVRTERLRAIALEAAEQTERLDVPDICEPESLDAVLAEWSPQRTLFFADEAGDEPDVRWGGQDGRAMPFTKALEGRSGPSSILIGPEGGFTVEERAMLRSQESVVPISLGPNILRAETAAIVALAIWQSVLGDWRS